ncbi:MAG: hypothetical protein AB1405_09735, partial [Bdellovibrionota bacterium]
ALLPRKCELETLLSNTMGAPQMFQEFSTLERPIISDCYKEFRAIPTPKRTLASQLFTNFPVTGGLI